MRGGASLLRALPRLTYRATRTIDRTLDVATSVSLQVLSSSSGAGPTSSLIAAGFSPLVLALLLEPILLRFTRFYFYSFLAAPIDYGSDGWLEYGRRLGPNGASLIEFAIFVVIDRTKVVARRIEFQRVVALNSWLISFGTWLRFGSSLVHLRDMPDDPAQRLPSVHLSVLPWGCTERTYVRAGGRKAGYSACLGCVRRPPNSAPKVNFTRAASIGNALLSSKQTCPIESLSVDVPHVLGMLGRDSMCAWQCTGPGLIYSRLSPGCRTRIRIGPCAIDRYGIFYSFMHRSIAVHR